MRMRATVVILLVGVFVSNVFADYDLILTGIQDYNISVSYSNKNILVADSAFVMTFPPKTVPVAIGVPA
ncbi:MAG: hypothetical protein CVV39_03290 [Planctomycetes bacterium HGW-Planctomycetes-1]|nr:MAG: hypothetical protein CVV39_03290 [Planctomycetes bacterium HGW-Planctomycetes-1]